MPPVFNANFDRWKVFQLARAHNYLRHRETHRTLRRFLQSRFPGPFTVLDLGCGDAREMARTLDYLPVTRYVGVDTSPELLAVAEKNLGRLRVLCSLREQDALAFLCGRGARVEVIWLGLFLHHFPRSLKRELFTLARQRLRPGGCLLAHDPMLREDETRASYLQRLARACRREWRAIAPADKTVLHRHWSRHGRQERFSTLARLAHGAGFSRSEILYRDPQDFYALTGYFL
jgi:SAM-dependent methyltransferase